MSLLKKVCFICKQIFFKGTWNEWAAWSTCSSSCWDDRTPSTRVRSRTCNNVLGPCHGDLLEVLECNTNIICKGEYLKRFFLFEKKALILLYNFLIVTVINICCSFK